MKRMLLLVMFSTSVMAESSSLNLSIPSAGSTYGQDSIRSGDLDCKNAIGGATQLEFGVTGIIDNVGSGGSNEIDMTNPQTKDIGIFARIVIPLDGPAERINCNSLYQLELRKKRIEVLKLQEELNALKRLNASNGGFEN